MPSAASSSAIECMRCRAPALAAMYAAPIAGSTLVAASEVVTMIRPNLRGPHVAGRCARGREDPVEVDVDHAIPALVAVTLERPLVHPRPLAAGPRADEADAGIDAGVGERDVEPAVELAPPRRSRDRARRGRSRRRPPPVRRGPRPEAATPVAPTAPASMSIKRDARAVRRHDLAVREPQAAGTAGDDHAETGHIESRGNVHGAREPIAPSWGLSRRAGADI